jgi:hypothetical protein
MKKIYESVYTQTFSMDITINGKSVRLSFLNGTLAANAYYQTSDLAVQKEIEASPLFGHYVQLKHTETETTENQQLAQPPAETPKNKGGRPKKPTVNNEQ